MNRSDIFPTPSGNKYLTISTNVPGFPREPLGWPPGRSRWFMHDAFLNFYLIFWTCGTESQSQKQTCRVKQSLRIPNHASGEAACREKRERKPDREESDYFSCLQSYHRPVNDLSTVVQLTNRLLRFWADGGFVYYKRVSSPSFLVSSRSLYNNIVVCNRAGWDQELDGF